MPNGHAVSRSSDFIIYSVEAESIDRVVEEYGPSTKLNAIVAGQTSVKEPEIAAFEKHLPPDVYILTCHSLHGPTVDPTGQPLVLIQHRAPKEALTLVESILSALKSRYVYLSYKEHDILTANTQAVTHAAFLSMGTAWRCRASYPWSRGYYTGGIETAKVNITLRIYSNAWHVYAGLAILNPAARDQIKQFSKSATELYNLMRGGEEAELRRRVEWAKTAVFGNDSENAKCPRKPILLSQDLLDRFSIGPPDNSGLNSSAEFDSDSSTDGSDLDFRNPDSSKEAPRRKKYLPNSHLSLLAMVDCWAELGINPYEHLALAATPIFRLFLGVAEHLFLATASPSSYMLPQLKLVNDSEPPSLLSVAIGSALHDSWHHKDDLEFVIAARGWAECVKFGSFELYKDRFEETRSFFEEMFEEARVKGSEMIKAIMETELSSANEN